MKRSFLSYAVAALAGYVILSLELLGLRLFAPYFGYSLPVSGSLIGITLFALALGYWLGGFLSDRGIRESALAPLLLGAGAYLAVAAIFSPPILELFSFFGVATGSVFAALVFFVPPMIVLASVSPFLIKLLAEKDGVGQSAGSIYAVGTIGSLIGNFGTAFYAVPVFGARASFLSDAVLVLLVGALWSFAGKRRLLGALALAGAALVPLSTLVSSPRSSNVIAAYDSPYARLEVTDQGRFIALRAGRRSGTAFSYAPKGAVWRGISPLYDAFAALPALHEAETALILGLGAGTLAHLHQEVTPDLSIVGVELDPKIIEVGRSMFRLDEARNIARIVVADARPFLRRTEERYDLIEVDLFKEAEVPFYVATKEFFELTERRLAPKGLMAMNVYDPSPDKKILAPLANTVAAVYAHVAYIAFPLGSHLLVASDSDPLLREKISPLGEAHPVAFSKEQEVFTDDLTSLERLSYRAIFGE